MLPTILSSKLVPGSNLKCQLYVDMQTNAFGNGFVSLLGTFDQLFFVGDYEGTDIRVEPIDPYQVAQRIVFSPQYKRHPCMAYYMAFPERHNPLIEQAEEIQRRLLTRVLVEKPTYVVYHPYPVPIPELFTAVEPLIQSTTTSRELVSC